VVIDRLSDCSHRFTSDLSDTGVFITLAAHRFAGDHLQTIIKLPDILLATWEVGIIVSAIL
jgi:hypothetical protein